MTFYADKETEVSFKFDWESVYQQVAEAVLALEDCPYEVQISLILTDNPGIQEVNQETRELDAPTDVLSFPNLEFSVPSDFKAAENAENDCFDPDSGELILGDIMISVDKVREQAEEYGHSERREFAFLVAHSMFHLCGYDHLTAEEEEQMTAKQETVLQQLKITRD